VNRLLQIVRLVRSGDIELLDREPGPLMWPYLGGRIIRVRGVCVDEKLDERGDYVDVELPVRSRSES
jgi:hypothetical protein